MCDIHQEGKLNPEQFMLAMWLISRKQAGKDPPAALTPDMVPPTMRPKGQDAVSTLDLQLNLHETDLLFRNLSHHLTWHCLLIPGFPRSCLLRS